jgi:hypothetical protein
MFATTGEQQAPAWCLTFCLVFQPWRNSDEKSYYAVDVL